MQKIYMILLMFCLAGCAAGASQYGDLETVPRVDLKRYAGDWYEIARIDHWFQKGCVSSTARYEIRDDGDVDVINQCINNGEFDEAKGRAWVTDDETNAKLKVQFPLRGIKLPFLAGNYWIIDLDEDYRFAMVGEQGREYLWILSRDKEMPEETLNLLVKRAQTLGFPVEKLIYEQ